MKNEKNERKRNPLPPWLVMAIVCVFQAVGIGVARAGETGTLKLMVSECGGKWLDGATVDVAIYRPGTGQVAQDTGYTSDGYVELTFYDLENLDQARVRVTPASGGTPDSDHTYYWIAGDELQEGGWDIGDVVEGACQDSWYDESQNIIHCVYEVD